MDNQKPLSESSDPSRKLPNSGQVNVSALARLFYNTTNSYKYLFFLSILDILERRQFEFELPISFQDMIVEMLANAWYPHTFFKLSFGALDKIAQKLDSLDMTIDQPIIQSRDTDKKLLREAIASQDLKDIISHLRRYVPFRLIIPFVESHLGSVSRKGDNLDRAMPEIVDRYFEVCKPLYRFNSTKYKDCKTITIHPDWASYLKQHCSIIRGWTAWEWLTYMQKCNPSTPAVANKLFMPIKRESLNKQSEYWRLVLRSQQLHCIYSNEIISPKQFSLDHYLPWSFVTHYQLWILIPTLPEVNSSKSNNLPDEQYFDNFVHLQYIGLTTTHSALGESQWEKQIESYISDLGIGMKNDLLSVEKLRNAYAKVLNPLLALAANQGFSVGWHYSK